MSKKQKQKRRAALTRTPAKPVRRKAPFQEHLRELKRRVFYVALSVGVWSTAAYLIQQHIVSALLRPSHGQNFVYTSPLGGIDFLFRVCLYTGFIFSIPVIVYQLLRYTEPLLKHSTTRFIAGGTAASGILALVGILFGYFVGLPSALHFLLHQFVTGQIKPLITVQSYMSFVMVYMVGSALMLQIPLLLIFINRIKPLKPQKLLHHERWVILLAFVMAGLMNPTPRILDQLVVAGPIIIMYQVGIGIVWLMNRPRWPSHAAALYQEDLSKQEQRLRHAKSVRPLVDKPRATEL
jgi:sec-independent protein translocase protein TatC